MILEVTPLIHLLNINVAPQMITVDVECPVAPDPDLEILYSASSLLYPIYQYTTDHLKITINEFSVK
jgi:hypothetical protein